MQRRGGHRRAVRSVGRASQLGPALGDPALYVVSGFTSTTNYYQAAASTFDPATFAVGIIFEITAAPGASATVAGRTNTAGSTAGFQFNLTTGRVLSFRAHNGTAMVASSNITLTDNQFYAVVGVCDGTHMYLYTEAGAAGAGVALTTAYNPGTHPVTVGCSQNGNRIASTARIAGMVIGDPVDEAGAVAWCEASIAANDITELPTTSLLYSVKQSMSNLSSDNPWVAVTGTNNLTRTGAITVTRIATPTWS